MNTLLKFLKVTCIVLGLLYLGICALLYFNQESLLFFPQPRSAKQTAEILRVHQAFDTLGLATADGKRIYVYLSKDTCDNKLPLAIYFGGNAEEVSHLMECKSYFSHTRLALVNYRGYGMSRGSVSQDNMFSDALAIYDQLVKDTCINKHRIYVIGRSIGTGVAVYLSAQRQVKGTILFTPYESMSAVAQEKYAFVPIGLLLKHPFPSETYATSINTPVLAFIAKRDAVIPPPHAYRLLKAWKGTTTGIEVNEDHNSITGNTACWKHVEHFMTH